MQDQARKTYSLYNTVKEQIGTFLVLTLLIDFGFSKDFVKALLTELEKKDWLGNVDDKELD
jgi:hypothetical protein